MSDVEQWRWVDADGSQHAVVLDELQRLLATGVLPPYVLVWKPSWKEWVHAMDAPDLAGALGSMARQSHPPSVMVDALEPPAPPLERYEPLGHVRGKPLLGTEHSLSLLPNVTPVPPLVRRPIAVRNVMPTLAEESSVARSNTLRPIGAMPPPPRAMPPPGKIPIFDELDRSSSASGDFMAPSGPPEGPRYQSTEVGPTPIPEKDTTPPLRRRIAQRNVWIGAASLGLIAAGVIYFMLSRRDGDEAIRNKDAAGSTSRAPGAGTYCVQQASAKRLAPNAYVSVPPLFAQPEHSPRVAIGFASGARRAVGMMLDPGTLTFDVPFQKDATNDIVSVVPAPGKDLDFVIDEQGGNLPLARTVGGTNPFTLGFTKDGLVRRDARGEQVVWRGDWKADEMTVPRVATAAGVGHAVAIRRGDRSPTLLFGWLTPEGNALTELTRLPTTVIRAGVPSVAVNDESVLVTFASQGMAKPGPKMKSDAWQIKLAAAPLGKVPTAVADFEPPEGGPGENAISPSAAGLDKGRFLIQWAEGSAGGRVVRAVTLASNLVPEGEPITLSPPGANAGQGALWAHGGRAVALFFVQDASTHELWGATLKCP